jgi:SAM-dependent methyltransferase
MSANEQGELWSVAPETWAEAAERRSRPLFEAVFERLGLTPQTRLLDVGCGSGLAAALAAERGAVVTGVDAAEGLLGYARRRATSARFVAGDLERLPFDDDAFDVVTAFNSMPYADDLARGLRELRRVTAVGGTVVVTAGAGSEQVRCAAAIAALAERPPAADRSATDLADPHRAALAVERAGLATVDVSEVRLEARFADSREAIDAQLAAGPVEAAVRRAGRPAVAEALRAYFEPLVRDDGSVGVPLAFTVVFATKPGPGGGA